MHDLGGVLTTALSIVSLATLAGLGLLRGTVINLREQLKDARDEVAALRGSRVDDQTKIAQLTADHDALTRVVTGEAHWVAIGQKLDEHHDEAKDHWATDERVLGEIRDELRGRR